MASMVKDLVEAGVHFGHRSTNWNPKMAPYIFGKRNKIHIIDVKATIRGLLLARKYLIQTVANGKDVLFVGTKRQARTAIEREVRAAGMHFVTERWLGGTLTNFRTIRDRLKRLVELERLEETGQINTYSKKMESQLRREKSKILRNLDGIRNMTSLPGVMVVIDVARESNAVKEARSLGIPTVCLIDTDSNPDYADLPIPGNDDAMRVIELVVTSLCAAVMEGKNKRRQAAEGSDAVEGSGAEGGERESLSPVPAATAQVPPTQPTSSVGSVSEGAAAVTEAPTPAPPAAGGSA